MEEHLNYNQANFKILLITTFKALVEHFAFKIVHFKFKTVILIKMQLQKVVQYLFFNLMVIHL